MDAAPSGVHKTQPRLGAPGRLQGTEDQSQACAGRTAPGPQGAPRAHRPSRSGGGRGRRATGEGAGAALPGVRRPGPRGVLSSGDFFSRAAKTPAALQARVCRPWLFPSPLSPAAAGQFLGSKSLLQGFQSPRGGRRLQGALPDSPRAQGGVALLVPRVCGPLPALGCL